MKRLDPPKARFFGRRAPRLRELRLRDAVILTSPLLILVAYLVGSAVGEYRAARLFDDWWSRRVTVKRAFDERVRELRKLPALVRVGRALDPEAPDPARLRLRVDSLAWADWQRAPLNGWGDWLDAQLVDGNEWLKVKLRKRGDTSVHWLTEKKSFTLKTPRRSLYKGFRRLVFSAKTPVEQVVSNGLAGAFDLLAPETFLAPVYVNDRFYGLFRATELVDESFLRRRHRMPGNVFRADAAERGEVYKGLPRGVFDNPVIWERVAKNDRPGADAAAITPFLSLVSRSTFAGHRALMKRLDPDEWSRLVAYLLVVGDPYHMSFVHNHYLYEDPTTGLLHPIPWDIRLMRLDAPPEAPLNPLLRAVLRDPFVFAGAMQVIADQLRDGGLPARAEALLAPLRTRYAPALAYEHLRSGTIPPAGDPDHAFAILRANLELLSARLDDARVSSHAERDGDAVMLDFLARGFVGPELRALRVTGLARGAAPRLIADRDLDGRRSRGDRVVPTHAEAGGAPGEVRLVLDAPERLLPGTDAAAWDLEPGPLHYRFFLETGRAAGAVTVTPELVNPLRGTPVEPQPWARGEVVPASDAWHPWRYPSHAPQTRSLAGEVQLHETLVVPAGDTLEIAPGTTLVLDPDVSLLARGRVLARGSAARPIRFVPAQAGRPWGALALQGAGADGSVFEYVHFEGGGGALLDHVEYKGMVSVHRLEDVRFDHCVFADNLRADDMINVVHTRVSIRDSLFRNANGDGIDFDYGSGEVVNTRIEDARNDGLDLMTSTPVVSDTIILRSGDKGISVGEASAPVVFRTRIADGKTAIEVKDRSEPVVLECDLRGNRVGVRGYEKNWRYGAGGWPKLVDTPLDANARPLDLEDGSRLTVGGDGDAASWIRAQYGLGGASPTAPLEWRSLSWNFDSLRQGWRAARGVSRLLERDGRLSATLPRGPGAVERDFRWDLTRPGFRYLAVVELGGRGIAGGTLRFVRADEGREDVRAALGRADEPGRWHFETVELPPGRYRLLRVEAVPADGGGRLDLRGTRLYALPAPSRVAARRAARSSGATTSERGWRPVQ